MMRILLAWELGGNYGHIAMLLPVARHLRQCGHELLFVVKDLAEAGPLLESAGFRYILSPRRPAGKKRMPPPASFSDILARAGFGNPEILSNLIRGWRDVFTSFQPEVILAQYAPLAVFAARLAGLPCLQLNTGFEYPPEIAPFPCFRPDLRHTAAQLLAREKNLLESINQVCAENGRSPIPRMQDVLKADINLLATFPEMDHYGQRQKERYIGPISIGGDGINLCWAGRKAHRIFLYLRNFPGLESILETLKNCDAEVIACIPGASTTLLSSSAGESIRISTVMIRLSGILADADLAITHAGHGTTAQSFLAGVPMLMIPSTIEQWLLTRKMEQLGVGRGVRRDLLTAQFSTALTNLLGDNFLRHKAKIIAMKYAGYDQKRVIERIANTVDRLPAWRQRQL